MVSVDKNMLKITNPKMIPINNAPDISPSHWL
jgi:hypothetical protein